MKPFTILILFPLLMQSRAPKPHVATLAWTQGDVAGGCAVTSNNIYRGTVSNAEILLATTPAATTYSDTTVKGGSTYFYKVSAVNCNGESPLSGEVSARIPGKPN